MLEKVANDNSKMERLVAIEDVNEERGLGSSMGHTIVPAARPH